MSGAEKATYRLMGLVLAAFALTGLAYEGPLQALRGFLVLQLTPGRLISDFTVIGGVGAALINAAAVEAIALGIVRILKVRLSGPTIAATFTMMGFSLFGTTPFNSVPIILGVFMASRIARTPFSHYLLIALFGTSLGPLLDFLFLDAGLSAPATLLAGATVSMAAGILLPSLAMVMLRLHEGFCLYNIGFTAGFISLFASSILIAANQSLPLTTVWNHATTPTLVFLIPALCILLAVGGILMDGKKAFTGLVGITKLSGRLPSDFMDLVSPGATLVNMAILGLLGCAYVAAVGGDFNGPTIGGLMTVIGFGAFGKHPRNCASVVLGIFTATILFGKAPSAPGPLLAMLFGTTLAPLAGEFGPVVGFIAGMLHLTVVDRSAAWQGGLNLYNNGFAGGLSAMVIVAVLEWYRTNRSK